MLHAAGQPALVLEQDTSADRADAVARDPAFQAWLLEMLEFVTRPTDPAARAPVVASTALQTNDSSEPDLPPATVALKKSLVAKLRKWHRQVLAAGLNFEQLSVDKRHALRKKAKKLRYALQFTEALLPRERLRHYRKQLANVQDILGEMNDLAVARERFVGLRAEQPSAWFACGWITSRLDALTLDACAAFRQLSRTEHFWR